MVFSRSVSDHKAQLPTCRDPTHWLTNPFLSYTLDCTRFIPLQQEPTCFPSARQTLSLTDEEVPFWFCTVTMTTSTLQKAPGLRARNSDGEEYDGILSFLSCSLCLTCVVTKKTDVRLGDLFQCRLAPLSFSPLEESRNAYSTVSPSLALPQLK